MKTKNLLLASIGALTFASSGIAAQPSAPESGFYIGFNVGRSDVDVDTSGIDSAVRGLGVASSKTSTDDHDTGWRFGAGYQFNRYFGAELSYTDFGKFSIDTVTTGPTVKVSGDVDAKTFSLDAVLTAPLGAFDLFGRVGAHRWDADTKIRASSALGNESSKESDNGTDMKYGFGARWNFTRNLGIQVEWERYKDVGDKGNTGQADVDLISAGLRYKF